MLLKLVKFLFLFFVFLSPLFINVSSYGKRIQKRLKREVPEENGEELNQFVDNLLRFITRFVKANEPIQLANPIFIQNGDYNVSMEKGKLTNVYKVKRIGPASVIHNNDSVNIDFLANFKELNLKFGYNVNHDQLSHLYGGIINIRFSNLKVYFKLFQMLPPEDDDDFLYNSTDVYPDDVTTIKNGQDMANIETFEEENEDEEINGPHLMINEAKVIHPEKIDISITGIRNKNSTLKVTLKKDSMHLEPLIRILEKDGVAELNERLEQYPFPILEMI